MRLVPPAIVRKVSELSPGDLAKVPVFDDRPTLVIAAKLENGPEGLVCLEPGRHGQGVPKGRDFPFLADQARKAAICLGQDYTFSLGDFSQAQSYRQNDADLAGALLLGSTGHFLRIECILNGFKEARYLNTATGSLLDFNSEIDLPFASPSWQIYWANHGASRNSQPPIFSFPPVT